MMWYIVYYFNKYSPLPKKKKKKKHTLNKLNRIILPKGFFFLSRVIKLHPNDSVK